MEGANPVMQWVSQLSPLTHIPSAARAIMLDEAGLAEISVQLLVLVAMSALFLVVGTLLFK